jgi:ketosteroid isomerase-like protein
MKMRLLLTVAELAIGFALPAFTQQSDPVDSRLAQQIRVLAMKYDEAINKHDGVAVAALYTQDAVRATYNHGTFHGRQAIEKAFANWDFKRWQVSNYFTSVGPVSPAGNELRSVGTWSCAFQTPPAVPGMIAATIPGFWFVRATPGRSVEIP